MNRFYCPQIESGVLSEDESHHATHVLRLKEGATVSVFNGKGREAHVRLSDVRGRQVKFKVLSSTQRPEPSFHVSLAQAVTKSKAMDFIIQKATELGVSEIWPILSERSVVHLNVEKGEQKQEKWQHITLEACKQCGRTILPTVHEATNLDGFLKQAAGRPGATQLIASLQPEARLLGHMLGEASKQPTGLRNVLFLIGPEGDFTPSEIGRARAAGFLPVSLGPNVLRSETASLFVISAIAYEQQKQYL